jgi:DNA (cytosine-5)-methyltransferase 1
MEQAGFSTVALVERNPHACHTLRINRPQWRVLETDVREIDFATLGHVDVVAGGPPCQPFSMGGKANGYNDQRDMFPQAVRAVRELRPKAFIFENVRGLLRPCFRNYVEYVRLQLTYPDFPISMNADWETNLRRLERYHTSAREAGDQVYDVTINLANAADYGVPQHRHRVFFVGFRRNTNTRWFFPPATHCKDALLYEQWVTGAYWKTHKTLAPVSGGPVNPPAAKSSLERWRTVRDGLMGLGEPSLRRFEDAHWPQPGAKSYPGHTGSPLDEPAKALKAGDHGVPGGENMLRYHDGTVRYFSVRESARIQTFPDSWRFAGSWTESMRQLGNAVPVRLGQVVAASVLTALQPRNPAQRVQSAR